MNRDETENFDQNFEPQIVKDDLVPQLEKEYKDDIDEAIELELKNIKLIKQKKKKKEKKKKKKKGKKAKAKKLPLGGKYIKNDSKK